MIFATLSFAELFQQVLENPNTSPTNIFVNLKYPCLFFFGHGSSVAFMFRFYFGGIDTLKFNMGDAYTPQICF